MEADPKDNKNTEGRIFKRLEFIAELIGWLQIVISPLAIGLALGAIIYFSHPSTLRLILGIIVAAIGLFIGIKWATKQWKGKGTMFFLSRIMASPELDKPEEELNNVNTRIKASQKDQN